MAEHDKLDEGLASDLLKIVPLHDSVFEHIDEAIRQLEHAAAELMRQD
jgi:hypothetical protein